VAQVEQQGKVIVVAMAVPLVEIQRVAVVVEHQPLVQITVVGVAVLAGLELHQAYLVQSYFILEVAVAALVQRVAKRLAAQALEGLVQALAIRASQLQAEVVAVAVHIE
tara:strand:- start:82 stop:408 length:327 start_codon:yes stop_codon:yes gene_type:complete